MKKTEPASIDGHSRPITYFGITYDLTPEDTHALAAMDQVIQARLGDAIFFAPDGTRHITIMNITSVAEGRHDEATIRFFEEHEEMYRSVLREIAKTTSAFEVNLYQLEAHANAIILRGDDQRWIDAMRQELYGLPRFGGRLIDPGFVHSTQARYLRQVPLEQIRTPLSDIVVAAPLVVDKISLVRADTSFSEPHVVLEEFALQ